MDDYNFKNSSDRVNIKSKINDESINSERS